MLDPSATYLFTNRNAVPTSNNDHAPDATAIDLADLGFAPGDFLRFERVGSFTFNQGGPTGLSLLAVFSSGAVLLDSSNVNRVAGAIDAGAEFATGNTHHGNLATDIAQDFFVPGIGNATTSVIVQIPAGAAYLFFSAHDSFYQDNVSGADGYGVDIARVEPTSSNPEPSSLIIFALGGAIAASVRGYRRFASPTA